MGRDGEGRGPPRPPHRLDSRQDRDGPRVEIETPVVGRRRTPLVRDGLVPRLDLLLVLLTDALGPPFELLPPSPSTLGVPGTSVTTIGGSEKGGMCLFRPPVRTPKLELGTGGLTRGVGVSTRNLRVSDCQKENL